MSCTCEKSLDDCVADRHSCVCDTKPGCKSDKGHICACKRNYFDCMALFHKCICETVHSLKFKMKLLTIHNVSVKKIMCKAGDGDHIACDCVYDKRCKREGNHYCTCDLPHERECRLNEGRQTKQHHKCNCGQELNKICLIHFTNVEMLNREDPEPEQVQESEPTDTSPKKKKKKSRNKSQGNGDVSD